MDHLGYIYTCVDGRGAFLVLLVEDSRWQEGLYRRHHGSKVFICKYLKIHIPSTLICSLTTANSCQVFPFIDLRVLQYRFYCSLMSGPKSSKCCSAKIYQQNV